MCIYLTLYKYGEPSKYQVTKLTKIAMSRDVAALSLSRLMRVSMTRVSMTSYVPRVSARLKEFEDNM
jgi:hypothetical protein